MAQTDAPDVDVDSAETTIDLATLARDDRRAQARYIARGLADEVGANPTLVDALAGFVGELAECQYEGQNQTVTVVMYDAGAAFVSVRSNTSDYTEGELSAPTGHVRLGPRGGLRDGERTYIRREADSLATETLDDVVPNLTITHPNPDDERL